MIELMKIAENLKTMTFGQKMLGALNVTLVGMGTTFIVLIILMFTIKILSRSNGKKTEAAPGTAPAPAAAPAPAPAAQDEGEVVAAIVAAITMMQGNSSFRIRNIYPAPVSTGWIAEGRRDVFSSRKSQI